MISRNRVVQIQSATTDSNSTVKSFGRLMQIIRNDELIYTEVSNLLQLEIYQRRLILNNWLEQLRIQKAPKDLQEALTCLFDDKIADQVLSFIKKHH